MDLGNFQSREKDGSHTIRSAIAKRNHTLHKKFMVLCFIELDPIKVLRRGNGDFRPLSLL